MTKLHARCALALALLGSVAIWQPTSADALASFNRVLSKDIASPLASRLAALDTATAQDTSTVVLTLKEPSAPLLASLASIAIVPRSFEANKDGLQRSPVGSGPFKFKDWQPNSFIELSKHAGYWNKAQPKVDGVKFNIVPESATRQVGISSGQYDMLPNIDAATALQLRASRVSKSRRRSSSPTPWSGCTPRSHRS